MNNDARNAEDFLNLSVALTGFSRFELQGTGQASLFFSTVSEILGEEMFLELLRTFHSIEARANGNATALAEGLRYGILGTEKCGPIARNIIKLWYVGTWYQLPYSWRNTFGTNERDVTYVVSPVAFTEGLLWPTLGVNPPAAKAQGYGTWAEEPSVRKGINE